MHSPKMNAYIVYRNETEAQAAALNQNGAKLTVTFNLKLLANTSDLKEEVPSRPSLSKRSISSAEFTGMMDRSGHFASESLRLLGQHRNTRMLLQFYA